MDSIVKSLLVDEFKSDLEGFVKEKKPKKHHKKANQKATESCKGRWIKSGKFESGIQCGFSVVGEEEHQE